MQGIAGLLYQSCVTFTVFFIGGSVISYGTYRKNADACELTRTLR